MNRDNAAARRLFAAWLRGRAVEDVAARFATCAPIAAASSRDGGYGELADALLLAAALERAEGRRDAAASLVATVAARYARLGLPPPFQLWFQRGLERFAAGDHAGALELFLRARSEARHPLDAVCARSNVIYCLENLGLPFDDALADLRARLDRAPARAYPDPRALVDALEMRRDFRRGDVAGAWRRGRGARGGRVGQAAHYRLWLAELPYHRQYRAATPADRERHSVAGPQLYEHGYRIRTLQGVLDETDLRAHRDTMLADRVYLWTWRWLVAPDAFPRRKVLAVLAAADLARRAPRLTAEDYQLLRNALHWLALFTPSHASALDRLAADLRPACADDYPLFGFEHDLVSYLRGHDEKWRALTRSPLWRSTDLHLAQLARAARGERTDVAPSLASLVTRLRPAGDGTAVVVDPARGRVSWRRGRETVLSEPLCRALALLTDRRCVDFSAFAAMCFGFSRFDPGAHDAKIYNLLSRLKRCLPAEATVRTKARKIFAEGDWRGIRVAPAVDDASDAEWDRIVGDGLAPEPAPDRAERALLAEKAAGRVALTRAELERKLGLSRSAANRVLAGWLARGLVRREGRAKGTRYLLA